MSSNIEIAGREFRHGENLFTPGDKVVLEKYLRNKTMNERHVSNLREQGTVVPLTPESYARATVRFGDRHIGKGFTEDELVELGILPKAAATPKPAPEEPKAKPKKAPHRQVLEIGDYIPPTPESRQYKGYVLTPRARGSLPPLWDATLSDGKRLRDRSFQKIEAAEKFIDDLIAADLANKPAADTPEADATASAQEQTNGSDVQPEPV